jgi:hypothetical protein
MLEMHWNHQKKTIKNVGKHPDFLVRKYNYYKVVLGVFHRLVRASYLGADLFL